MNRSNLLIIILSLCFFLLLVGFSEGTLKKDFVSLDRAFIPPLALTRQDKLKPSKKAMRLLKENWFSFKGQYYDANPKDPGWKDDFNTVDGKILEAAKIVRNGLDLFAAHETLEEIRFIFMDLRKRNGIPYYLDHLSEFHEVMESIVHKTEDLDPDTMTESDKQEVRQLHAHASKKWDEIKSLGFDQELYGFSDQKLEKMNQYLKLESDALNRLKKALEKSDNAAIIKTAKGIKPSYAKLYKMFGDFESVKR